MKALLHESLLKDRLQEAVSVLETFGCHVVVSEGRRPAERPDAPGCLVLTTLQHAHSILTEGKALPGLWYRPEATKVSAWMPHLQKFMLNRRGAFLPWGALTDPLGLSAAGTIAGSEKVFVRPDSGGGRGGKPFPGQVVNILSRDLDAIQRDHSVAPETMIFVAPPVDMPSVEWRFWIVNRKVIAWTPYSWTEDIPWDDPPHAVLELAEHLAQHSWQPDIAWVADIIKHSWKGTAQLVEINAASTSGLYRVPLKPLFKALLAAQKDEIDGYLSLGDF